MGGIKVQQTIIKKGVLYMNTTKDNEVKRMMSIKEAVAYCGLGTNRGRVFLDEIGATVRIGKRVVFDRAVIDHYFDTLAADKQ